MNRTSYCAIVRSYGPGVPRPGADPSGYWEKDVERAWANAPETGSGTLTGWMALGKGLLLAMLPDMPWRIQRWPGD